MQMITQEFIKIQLYSKNKWIVQWLKCKKVWIWKFIGVDQPHEQHQMVQLVAAGDLIEPVAVPVVEHRLQDSNHLHWLDFFGIWTKNDNLDHDNDTRISFRLNCKLKRINVKN